MSGSIGVLVHTEPGRPISHPETPPPAHPSHSPGLVSGISCPSPGIVLASLSFFQSHSPSSNIASISANSFSLSSASAFFIAEVTQLA